MYVDITLYGVLLDTGDLIYHTLSLWEMKDTCRINGAIYDDSAEHKKIIEYTNIPDKQRFDKGVISTNAAHLVTTAHNIWLASASDNNKEAVRAENQLKVAISVKNKLERDRNQLVSQLNKIDSDLYINGEILSVYTDKSLELKTLLIGDKTTSIRLSINEV